MSSVCNNSMHILSIYNNVLYIKIKIERDIKNEEDGTFTMKDSSAIFSKTKFLATHEPASPLLEKQIPLPRLIKT